MKTTFISLSTVFWVGLVVGCQPVEQKFEVQPKKNKYSSARTYTCPQGTVSASIATNADFNVSLDGCFSYIVAKGGARTRFQVIITNNELYDQNFNLRVSMPGNNTNVFNYELVSVQGNPADLTEVTSAIDGGYQWTIASMPSLTTYRLVFDVYDRGVFPSGESSIKLRLGLPCLQYNTSSCSDNDDVRLVLQ
ncbi:hypothetical protein [Fibrisoma limi]|uniref:hypothetical protein n=1 Tax=Fibrisoma limi TaxID=663275 RepID=UPI001181A455|nr:hypothetical protein [Fibrisoma limi]